MAQIGKLISIIAPRSLRSLFYLLSDLFFFLISFLSIPEDFENDNTETLSTMLQLAYTLAAAVVLVFGKWNTFSNLT